MSSINIEECDAARLDHAEVLRISRGLSRYARQAESLGIQIFGGSHGGTLRFRDDPSKGALIIADLDGCFDGGAGDQTDYGDGLIRGES